MEVWCTFVRLLKQQLHIEPVTSLEVGKLTVFDVISNLILHYIGFLFQGHVIFQHMKTYRFLWKNELILPSLCH